MKIQDLKIFKNQAFIEGQWINADTGATFAVINPADSTILAQIPDLGVKETERAITAANKAFKSWKNLPAENRATLLRKWGELIEKHSEELAILLTLEQGKSLTESKSEIQY